MATLSSFQSASVSEAGIMQDEQKEPFPYPDIPFMITSPKDRAAYLLTHYWEKVDFSHYVLSQEDPLMEQGFVNFLSVFPHATDSVLHVSVANMIKHALVEKSRTKPLIDLVENYLYNPNSPMLNEDYYRIFLKAFLHINNLSLSTRERLKFHLLSVNKNKVGDKIPNFSILEKQNQLSRLYDISASSILLLFYDADCDACKEVLSEMLESEDLQYLVKSQQLKVVTICIEGSSEQWKKMSEKFPNIWLNGRAPEDSSLFSDFVFRAMPTIYLLDKDKKVILKDVTWTNFIAYCKS